MFASIRRGFGFLGQAVQMAGKDSDLLKPSIFAFFTGIILTVIGAIPMVAVGILLGDRDYGGVLLAVLGAMLLFAQYAVSYIFAGMTVRLVADYLAKGDGRLDTAWAAVWRNFFNILTLAAASALVKLVENLLGRNRRGGRNAAGAAAGGILEAVWTVATYFVLPAMMLEDLNLWQALKRATQIIKNNLLLVAVTEIGVGGVVGVIGFLLVVLALLLGGAIVYLIGAAANWSTAAIILGGGLGILTAGAIIAVVTTFSAYVNTAYHTCLFLWARQVEHARATGQADASVAAPAPVAAVLA